MTTTNKLDAEQTAAAVEKIRAMLTPDENTACPDDMLLRYWNATGKDAHHAAKRLRETLVWWEEEEPTKMFCKACRDEDPCSHYMHVACRDTAGRPVIYSCMALAKNKNVEDNRRHMISIFEAAISVMRSSPADGGGGGGDGGEQSWSWILDFHGFSIRDCDPRLARVFLHLAATYYPERLHHFWVIDAPLVFNTLWSAIERFIDPKTRSKISFLSLKKKRDALTSTLKQSFDSETLQWLITEMEENRRVKGSNKKYECAALRHLPPLPENERNDNTSVHCNLGSPAFLLELRNWPGPLPPQLTSNAKPGE